MHLNIECRKHICDGIVRFIIGMAKKLIIADTIAVPVDNIFALGASDLTPPLAIFGALCFALQIYFDFSGYSDMAIGLGRMFGFRFPENFDYPYISKSIREFWHRWHMTLSRFFRDYVYIPLGGSRLGSTRTCINLFAVFFLCGLWHGANWTYVFWGLYHGLFLFLERTSFGNMIHRLPNALRHVYVLSIVSIGWILFRSPSMDHAVMYLQSLMSVSDWNEPLVQLRTVADNYELFIFVVGCLCSVPIVQTIEKWSSRFDFSNQSPMVFQKIFSGARSIGFAFFMGVLFLLSLGTMSAQTYKAFIYFRF